MRSVVHTRRLWFGGLLDLSNQTETDLLDDLRITRSTEDEEELRELASAFGATDPTHASSTQATDLSRLERREERARVVATVKEVVHRAVPEVLSIDELLQESPTSAAHCRLPRAKARTSTLTQQTMSSAMMNQIIDSLPR